MKQIIWTGNSNTKGDSPDFHWDKCGAATLTETKCEQICTRRREITFAHLNPPVSSLLPKESTRLCVAARERNICIHVYGEGGGRRGGKKKKIKENIWQGDLQLWWNVCGAARAEAAALSVLSVRSVSAGRVAGRWEGGDASKWLYDSCYQV